MPPASTRAIEPPPAPTVCTSSTGSSTGKPATSRARRRGSAPATNAQSVEVPPTSSVSAAATPQARATRAAASSPAAGPESSWRTGSRAASAGGAVPPWERMISSSPGVPRASRSSVPATRGAR